MNEELFAQIKNLSMDIHALIKNGVKEEVDEIIEKRNQLLEQWFSEFNEQIEISKSQEAYLEELLQVEEQMVADLKQEQEQIRLAQKQQNQANSYQQMSDDNDH